MFLGLGRKLTAFWATSRLAKDSSLVDSPHLCSVGCRRPLFGEAREKKVIRRRLHAHTHRIKATECSPSRVDVCHYDGKGIGSNRLVFCQRLHAPPEICLLLSAMISETMAAEQKQHLREPAHKGLFPVKAQGRETQLTSYSTWCDSGVDNLHRSSNSRAASTSPSCWAW